MRADRSSLNVRGAVAHLLSDVWAFSATFAAGVAILATGWTRADAVASLVVAALMAWTGVALVRAAGRVFLEAAPAGVDPQRIGAELAAIDGVAQVHDLHVWEIGTAESALSAHVLVRPQVDCHDIGDAMRRTLAADHLIRHVTLQVDHVPVDGRGRRALRRRPRTRPHHLVGIAPRHARCRCRRRTRCSCARVARTPDARWRPAAVRAAGGADAYDVCRCSWACLRRTTWHRCSASGPVGPSAPPVSGAGRTTPSSTSSITCGTTPCPVRAGCWSCWRCARGCTAACWTGTARSGRPT